jgi:DNA-binding CsgD family transcriptional regulator
MNSTKRRSRSYREYLDSASSGAWSPSKKDTQDIVDRFQGKLSINSRFAPVTYLIDYSTKKYLYVAESCFDLFGYTARQWMEEGLEGYLSKWHPADFRIWNEHIFPANLKFLSSLPLEKYEHVIFSSNYRVRNPVGEYITVVQRSSYIPGNTPGKPLAAIGVAFDISHFKNNTTIVHTIEEVKDADDRSYNELLYKRVYDTDVMNPLLTSRELHILQLMAEGLSSKQIAYDLGVSIHTIHNHRKNMLQKTGAESSVQLINIARAHGLL